MLTNDVFDDVILNDVTCSRGPIMADVHLNTFSISTAYCKFYVHACDKKNLTIVTII